MVAALESVTVAGRYQSRRYYAPQYTRPWKEPGTTPFQLKVNWISRKDGWLQLTKLLTLEECSRVRDVWIKLPQNITFSMYVFNITNPNEVDGGSIPVLNEIGPYVYEEIKEKVDLAEDLDEDTITYSNKATWYFVENKSYPLTGDELITIPHLPLFAVLLMAEADFPGLVLGAINAALPSIYGRLKSVFMTVKARELMFDGVLFDCTARSLLPRAVCAVFKQNSKSLQVVAPNKYKFSMFGMKNGSAESVRMTVKRGTGDALSIGRLVMLDGKAENTVWSPNGDCNQLRGTDSTIFPPFRKPTNNSVTAYSPELCRSLSGVFEKEETYEGIVGYKYVLVLGDPSERSQQCYCQNPNRCYKRGTSDLNGAPLVASLPHFYGGDESYFEGVIGIKPEKKYHETSLLLEPISGTPLTIRKRLQVNIHLHPVQYVNLTRRLRPSLVPLFWVEESFNLGGELKAMLESMLFRNMRLAEGFKWTAIGSGAMVGLLGAILRLFKSTRTAPSTLGSIRSQDTVQNSESRP